MLTTLRPSVWSRHTLHGNDPPFLTFSYHFSMFVSLYVCLSGLVFGSFCLPVCLSLCFWYLVNIQNKNWRRFLRSRLERQIQSAKFSFYNTTKKFPKDPNWSAKFEHSTEFQLFTKYYHSLFTQYRFIIYLTNTW